MPISREVHRVEHLRRWLGRVRVLILAAVIVVASAAAAWSHEIPNDVVVQVYLKPEGQVLRLLVRAPLNSMRDMTWPFKAPDLLDVSRATEELTNAATLWIGDEARLYEDGRRLAPPRVLGVRATLPSDRAFESYPQALALVTGPRAPDTDDISVKEGFLDVLFEYDIASDRSRFSLEHLWGRLGVRVLIMLQLLQPDGRTHAFELGSDTSVIHLTPSWTQASRLFFTLGRRQFFAGLGALLFMVAMAIPLRRVRDLAVVAGAFVIAHTITLVAASYGQAPSALWFRPLVDTLMAVSIMYLAIENLAGARLQRRWAVAFGSGLVFGFGFATGLDRTLQFAGDQQLIARLTYLVGIEAALAVTLGVVGVALHTVFTRLLPERAGVVALSALVVHASWHWVVVRGSLLAEYQFVWPALTPAFLAFTLRWLMIAVAVAGLAWLTRAMFLRHSERSLD